MPTRILPLVLACLVVLAVAPATALAALAAITNPAAKVHHTSAVLSGHLDPSGDPGVVECRFDWGATVAYGNSAPCNEGNSFSAPADVTANLGNLTPGVTYHFRLHVETTSSGPFDGADQSFRPDTFPVGHPEIGSVGPDGTAASSFSEAYTLAFDRSARHLFVLNRKVSGIFGLDASSPPSYGPLAAFSPLSVPGFDTSYINNDQPDIAVDGTGLPSSGNVYYAFEKNFNPLDEPEYRVYGFDSSGAPLAGFPIKASNGQKCGVAVDSAGHLWVANHDQTIDEYSSAGVKIGSITAPKPGQDCKLAFAGNDDMYVAGHGGQVWKYTAASGYSSGTKITPQPNGNVAVDTATGNVYAAHYMEPGEGFPVGPVVYEYDSAGHLFGEFAEGAGFHVTVDPTNHNVFVAGDDGQVHIFDTTQSTIHKLPTVTSGKASAITGSSATLNGFVDPEGMPVTDCHIAWGVSSYDNTAPCNVDPGSGSGDVAVSATLTGLTPGSSYVFRVFASNAEGVDAGGNVVFSTNYPPSVGEKPVTGVTNSSADLNGLVNPKGTPTNYRFEWGPTVAYGNIVPVPDGDAGSAEGDVPVSGHIVGLAPNTRYFWRLAAESVNGAKVTAGSSFLTLGAPVVETTGAPIRTMTSAQLGARVAPRGFSTNYFFEYGSQGPCDANPCAQTAPQPAGADETTELVSEQIDGLEPGTIYHYRVVADNGQPGSPVAGADMSVTTRASEAPLSHGRFPGPPGSDRAYEQVSPPDTGGNPVNSGLGFSPDGNRALFIIAGGTSIAEEGNLFSPYFSQRTPTGWKAKSLAPPRSDDVGSFHWFIRPDAGMSTVIGLLLNETSGLAKIWRVDPDGTPRKLFETSSFVHQNYDVSTDGSRIIGITGNATPLDPEHPTTKHEVYDFAPDSPQLLSLLPNGEPPACGVSIFQDYFPFWKHTVSADGSVVLFATVGDVCSDPEKLYLRDLNTEQTKLVSTPPVSGPECDPAMLSLSPNDRAPEGVFFWTKSRLSPEDSAPASCGDTGALLDGDIYRYDIGEETVKCLTCVIAGQDADVYAAPGSERRVRGYILVSDDGSRVYFQSPNALVPGAPTIADAGSSAPGSTYRLDVGTGDVAFVAGPGVGLGEVPIGPTPTASTPDGSTVLFRSAAPFLNPLNGSDNGGMGQLYRYDDRDRSLICISCPTDGSPPRGPIDPIQADVSQGVSLLTDDGRTIAFVTPTPLVGADQNTPGPAGSYESGLDAYEWRDGRPLLVSDGLTNLTPETQALSIEGISGDGRDLYFAATTQYTPDALDGYRRLYDARIGGGFTYPTPVPPCPLEVCQGTPKGAPEERAPGTGTFSGPGNLAHQPVKRKGHRAKKHRKKHRPASAKKHAKHQANRDRRTSR